jgi:hypothetical protein
MEIQKYLKYKLCYIDETSEYQDSVKTLYFSELEPEEMWGDDWDDAPYEHNAGTPYTNNYEKPIEGHPNEYEQIDTIQVIMTNDYYPEIRTPRTGKLNSQFTVKDINQKVTPWLSIVDGDDTTHIQAGTTLEEFLFIANRYKKDLSLYVQYKLED